MATPLVSRRDLAFVLYQLLDIEKLCQHRRFQEHSRETFDAALDNAERLALQRFQPHNRKADLHEPRLVDGRVELIAEVGQALESFADAGFLAAHHDYDAGGMQLPWTVTQACFCFFQAANISTAAYPFLTIAAANLLTEFGNPAQRAEYLPPLLDGRYFGTMVLSEPQAGSSLTDVRTAATPTGEGNRYRIKGSKQWTSGGEHELADNIIHLVLARIAGAAPGVRGLSLFLVPRYRAGGDADGRIDNGVRLVGLNHKMGYRGTVNAALAFGDGDDCVGELIGDPGQGLAIMFHMMNEARIGVGLGAVMLGYSAYLSALDYARERRQGRAPEAKNPSLPQIALIEHADIKRMLLASKAYVEGGLALALFSAKLVDRSRCGESAAERNKAVLLLDILTPVLKAWCSDYALKANDHAIQVLGGYGYTRDFPVEQLYRDNRLNPIHEGTNGIQAIDLLGRKLTMQDGAACAALMDELRAAIVESRGVVDDDIRNALRLTLDGLQSVVAKMQRGREASGSAVYLANASVFMDMLGRIVLAWIWLKQATVASSSIASRQPLSARDLAFYRGKLKACQYVFSYELPLTQAQMELLGQLDTTCLDTEAAWF